ncbi:MAG TPA: alpha/beta hydrolase [Acidimicrobiia bacterium]
MPTTHAADGTGIAYEVEGSGPLLVLVHGLTENRGMWDPVVERLLGDYTCARLDMRGHGESDAPGDYDALGMAGDLAAVVEALDAPAPPVVVGHSMGGLLATAYAAGGAGPVRGVVNVDQGLRFSAFAQQVRPLAPALSGEAFGETFVALMEALDPEPLDAATRERLHELHAAASPDVVLALWRPLFESTDAELDSLVETIVLPNVQVPYLAIHGSDPGPGYAEWLTGHVPSATVEVWDGHGHWPHLVDPDRFADRVRAFTASL